jgi:hypothetical protein
MGGRTRQADLASFAAIGAVVKTVEAETDAMLALADAAVTFALAIGFRFVADRTQRGSHMNWTISEPDWMPQGQSRDAAASLATGESATSGA